MNAEKRIKNEAKVVLSKGNWSKSLGVFFILFASVLMVLFLQSFFVLGVQVILTPLFNTLAEFSETFSLETEGSFANALLILTQGALGNLILILGFLFIFPLYCGVKRYFFLLSKGEEATISDVFYYLTVKLKNCLLLGFRYGIFCVLKLLPCIAPAYIIVIVMMDNELSVFVNSLLTLCVFIIGIAGLAIWILWTSRQSLAIYLFIEDDAKPASFYVKESERITNGNLNKAIRKLMYSFYGCFLLALTGVGMLYFVPYFEMSMATSAKWMIKLQEEVH